MPGQYTAWKRRMSFPIRCSEAGQPAGEEAKEGEASESG
jgi:hypothetical protein